MLMKTVDKYVYPKYKKLAVFQSAVELTASLEFTISSQP